MADRIYGSGNATAALSPRMIFRGDSAKLWLLKDSTRFAEDELGFDTLTRTYFCRRDLEDSFVPKAGDIDFEFKKMRYWTHTSERKGGMTFFTVTYNGYLKLRARVVRSEWDEKLNEMSLTAIGGGATCNLIFVSGTVSSRYASPTRPSSAEPISAMPDLYVKIIGLRGSGGIQLEGSERLTVAKLRALFGVKIKATRTEFKRRLEGAVWMCDETVDSLPIQEAFAIQVS